LFLLEIEFVCSSFPLNSYEKFLSGDTCRNYWFQDMSLPKATNDQNF